MLRHKVDDNIQNPHDIFEILALVTKTKEYLTLRYHLVVTMIRIGQIIQMNLELRSGLMSKMGSRDISMRMSPIPLML